MNEHVADWVTDVRPRPGTPVPARVLALADGEVVRPVWVNALGGLTFEIAGDRWRRFVKWAPVGSGIDLAAEAARLAWASGFTPVPRLLDQGADEAGSWLLTEALPGQMAVVDRWKAEPATAVTSIGEGLRALHEALPADSCPFSWSVAERLADVRHRARLGLLDPPSWHPDHRRFSVAEALDLLADPPPVDALVVCHGDACAPNTLLADDGRFCGHVDLGSLGVADRWADLAVATWSTTWNYGPGWERPLLDTYGVATDPDRTRYYRLLYELGPLASPFQGQLPRRGLCPMPSTYPDQCHIRQAEMIKLSGVRWQSDVCDKCAVLAGALNRAAARKHHPARALGRHDARVVMICPSGDCRGSAARGSPAANGTLTRDDQVTDLSRRGHSPRS